MPIDEYQALEETAEILSGSDALTAIEAGLADLRRGDVVSLEEVRAELAERRRARWPSMTRVVLARAARTALLELDRPLIDAVEHALGLLEREPATGYELRGRLRGLRSLRVGSYRIIYQFIDTHQTARVVAILHRSVAYRSDPR